MKKLRDLGLLITAFVLPLLGFSAVAEAYSGSGAGTSGSPYQISTCSQLEEVNNNLSAYYELAAPIDCTGVTFTPIGNVSSAFTGNFNGNGYTIDNVTINTNTSDSAVFGRISGGSVNNVVISDAHVSGGANYTAAFAGQVDTSAMLSAIQVEAGTVTGQDEVAGMVASMDSSTITDSSVINTTVNGSVANPTSTNNIGGAIGQSISSMYSLSYVISASVNGNINGSSSTSVGGFVGSSNADTFNDTYSTASVHGKDHVGGFVGSSASSTIRRSYASGDVSGTTDVGGFSGYEGLNGIIDSFAAGSVTGTTAVGGFIGDVEGVGADANNSYFDKTRTGQPDCVGQDNGISLPTTCTGVNSGSAQSNYFFDNSTNQPLANWDFTNTWRTTLDSYPLLISAPERPNNDRVVRGATSIQVLWAVPADTGGSPVTSYDFGYRPANSTGPFITTTGLSASTFSHTVTGLSPNTQYEFEVRANNASGTGIWAMFITSTLADGNGTVTSSVSGVDAPDTGYGAPSVTSGYALVLALASITMIAAGIRLSRRSSI